MAFHLLTAEQARTEKTAGGTSSTALGYAVGTLCWVFSAGVYIAVKWISVDLPPWTLALARAFLAALVLLPFVYRYRDEMLKLMRERGWELLVVGGSGLYLTQGLVFFGLQFTNVINTGLILSLMPMITMVMAYFILSEPMNGWQVLGTLISFVGMVVIIVHGDLSRLLGLDFNLGELWIVAGAVLFGLYTVLLRRAKFKMDRLPLLVLLLLAGSVVGLPFAVVEIGLGAHLSFDMRGALALGYCAVIGGAMMYLLYNWSIEILGASKAGLLIYLQMVFVPLFAYLILGEAIEPYHLAGGALILIGILFVVLKAPSPDSHANVMSPTRS